MKKRRQTWRKGKDDGAGSSAIRDGRIRLIASDLKEPKSTVHQWIRWSEKGRPLVKTEGPFRKVDPSIEDDCSLKMEHQ